MSKKDKQAPQEKPKAALIVERVSVDELRLDPRNARLHPERNLTAIRASLERFGQQKPIVVKKDGTVVAGNGTLEVARQLGWTHVDVVRTELDGKDAVAFGIADNRTAELAEWDISTLMDSITSIGGGLDVGFADDDIESLKEAIKAADGVGSGDGPEYSSKIESPIYTPKLEKQPPVEALVDTGVTDKLLSKIESSELPKKVKEFLKLSAHRHLKFDYGMIAEYYAHANKETQELMEQSALVIIDFDKAIENGFIRMTDGLASITEVAEEDVDEVV